MINFLVLSVTPKNILHGIDLVHVKEKGGLAHLRGGGDRALEKEKGGLVLVKEGGLVPVSVGGHVLVNGGGVHVPVLTKGDDRALMREKDVQGHALVKGNG